MYSILQKEKTVFKITTATPVTKQNWSPEASNLGELKINLKGARGPDLKVSFTGLWKGLWCQFR